MVTIHWPAYIQNNQKEMKDVQFTMPSQQIHLDQELRPELQTRFGEIHKALPTFGICPVPPTWRILNFEDFWFSFGCNLIILSGGIFFKNVGIQNPKK